MDFNRWNRIAKGEQRNLKKVADLEVDRLYRIENICKTTTRYGEKITIGLSGNIYCYLPAKLPEALLSNDEAGLKEIETELRNGPVNLRRFESRGKLTPIEFVPDLPDMAGLEDLI